MASSSKNEVIPSYRRSPSPYCFWHQTCHPADQVGRVGIELSCLSVKHALDWVYVPEVSLANKLESE